MNSNWTGSQMYFIFNVGIRRWTFVLGARSDLHEGTSCFRFAAVPVVGLVQTEEDRHKQKEMQRPA